MADMYKRLKRLKGETFARTLRDFHNGILEIPQLDEIVCHAGPKAEPLLPYLLSLIGASDDSPTPEPSDPFTLLERAGYNAFHADTLEKQNSIESYFAPGELLCTFNEGARYEDYHIVHAIKKDADKIKRQDFKGREQRQDAYGTSVISIQILKSGGFISIKNRYNHTVEGCDNTFSSNPNAIIPGLSIALKNHFNVDFSSAVAALSDDFALINHRVFKYHTENNNIRYGDQAWAYNGVIHTADRTVGDALFGKFLFDNKNKILIKIDPEDRDSFADDFNRCYGGNRGLSVQNGNLTLNGEILIGTEESCIKTLYLPGMTFMSDDCLWDAPKLERFDAPDLLTMGDGCLGKTRELTKSNTHTPKLRKMGKDCLEHPQCLVRPEIWMIPGRLESFYDRIEEVRLAVRRNRQNRNVI